LTHTDEILGGQQPTPVPFTRDWYLGLVSHRGQLIGVIDLEGFAGADPKPWQQSDRLLALSSTLPVLCAIRVTQMIGVIDQVHLNPAHFNPKVPSATPPSWAPHSFNHSDGTANFSRHCAIPSLNHRFFRSTAWTLTNGSTWPPFPHPPEPPLGSLSGGVYCACGRRKPNQLGSCGSGIGRC
jgi:hypothetical protein